MHRSRSCAIWPLRSISVVAAKVSSSSILRSSSAIGASKSRLPLGSCVILVAVPAAWVFFYPIGCRKASTYVLLRLAPRPSGEVTRSGCSELPSNSFAMCANRTLTARDLERLQDLIDGVLQRVVLRLVDAGDHVVD